MQNKKIILESNLQGFFYEGLNSLNKKSLSPIPESVIYYSSDVLDKFSLTKNFFEISEGKVREKILGLKLLEAGQLSREEQKRVFKEVGDMSLLITGYFFESSQKKLVDSQYYTQLGKMAYAQLNNVIPSFLDIPSFYSLIATCFESLATLMALLASQNRSTEGSNFIFDKVMSDSVSVSDKEMLVSGIMPTPTRKVS
jgi:hypothetical protein